MRHCLCAFLLVVLSSGAALAQTSTVEEPVYTTLTAGWSWPADGPVADSYESGFTMAGAFRVPVGPNNLSGIEVGYSWFSLDTAKLGTQNPGSTFSGGNMGLLSITGENDLILGSPASNMRPFINSGLGYFRSFIDDATVTTGSTTSRHDTKVYKGSFFGFHVGAGAMIKRERFGIRLEASYHYLFAGGPDLSFFPVRGGLVFYP